MWKASSHKHLGEEILNPIIRLTAFLRGLVADTGARFLVQFCDLTSGHLKGGSPLKRLPC